MDSAAWVTFEGNDGINKKEGSSPTTASTCQGTKFVSHFPDIKMLDSKIGHKKNTKLLQERMQNPFACESLSKTPNEKQGSFDTASALQPFKVQLDEKKSMQRDIATSNQKCNQTGPLCPENFRPLLKNSKAMSFTTEQPAKDLSMGYEMKNGEEMIATENQRSSFSPPLNPLNLLVSSRCTLDISTNSTIDLAKLSNHTIDKYVIDKTACDTNKFDTPEAIGYDTDSSFSNETYDIDLMDNDSLLKDTRKQFPDELLFQASSALLEKKENLNNIIGDDTTESLKGLCAKDNQLPQNDDFPSANEIKEWTLLYRYPGQKRKIGSRRWVSAKITVVNETICISGRTGKSEIVKEIPLHPFLVFTLPTLHKQDRNESQVKVHSVKLQYVKYKEKRKVTSKFQFEHFPSYASILKIASTDIRSLKNFMETVENVLRKIKSHRDIGITHRHEEIFIDCDDICQYELDDKGNVRRFSITCQIRLRAFVTGAPNLFLFVNDVETYNKQRNRRGGQKLLKSNKWIQLPNAEYHPCVDIAASKTEGGIVFKPPDGCSFELMRFHPKDFHALPLSFKGCINFTSIKSLEIKAECRVTGEGKIMRYKKNCIVARFGIPDSWSSVFIRAQSLTRKRQYMKAKSNSKSFAPGIARMTSCFLEVSIGTARYEPEYKALVWRLGDLPVLEKQVPADAVQTLRCHIILPFEIDYSDRSILDVDVEFEVNHSVGSDIQIQEVLLPGKGIPDKWVCYRSAYSYKVLFEVVNEQRLALH